MIPTRHSSRTRLRLLIAGGAVAVLVVVAGMYLPAEHQRRRDVERAVDTPAKRAAIQYAVGAQLGKTPEQVAAALNRGRPLDTFTPPPPNQYNTSMPAGAISEEFVGYTVFMRFRDGKLYGAYLGAPKPYTNAAPGWHRAMLVRRVAFYAGVVLWFLAQFAVPFARSRRIVFIELSIAAALVAGISYLLDLTMPVVQTPSLPVFLALFGIACVIILLTSRAAAARDRARNATAIGGRCDECDYDLTGNESGRCPECGTVIDVRRAVGVH